MSQQLCSQGRDWPSGLVASLAFCIVACGGPQSGHDQAGSAVLAIHGAPAEAQVFIDEHPHGTIARTGGAYLLEPGQRRLRVDAPGYLPLWLDIDLAPGEAYDLDVELWPCFDDVDESCPSAGSGGFYQLPIGE